MSMQWLVCVLKVDRLGPGKDAWSFETPTEEDELDVGSNVYNMKL